MIVGGGKLAEGLESGASETSKEAMIKVQATGGAERSVGARDAGRADPCGSQSLGTRSQEEKAQNRGGGEGRAAGVCSQHSKHGAVSHASSLPRGRLSRVTTPLSQLGAAGAGLPACHSARVGWVRSPLCIRLLHPPLSPGGFPTPD